MTVTDFIAYAITLLLPCGAIYIVLVLDLFDTGKGTTVGISTLWGMFGAFGLAYVINTYLTDQLSYETTVTRTAPILEEYLKALILFYFIQQPRFHYFIDGAVYGFVAGIGFALSENLLYITNHLGDSVLHLALSRVFSAMLMHATASALVGISFGFMRRSKGIEKYLLPVFGMAAAVTIHLIYNNVLFRSEGTLLLVTGIVIGLGGGLLIFIFIDQGQVNEKKRFATVLSGSAAERMAVQQYGSDEAIHILDDAADLFGREKANLIQQYLIHQANIGILKTNLSLPSSDYLKAAWQTEIDALTQQVNAIQESLGMYIMTFFLRHLLPEDNPAMWKEFSQRVMNFAPTKVHAFDVYIANSHFAHLVPIEKLQQRATFLKQIPIFEQVSLHHLENLSRAMTRLTYEPKQIIFERGDAGDAMFFVTEGAVDIIFENGVYTIHAGDVFGELSLLDNLPRSVTATAQDAVSVLVLKQEHFNLFIQSRPPVMLAMMSFLATRVRNTTAALETGVTWAENLAVGNYEQAKKLAVSSPYLNGFQQVSYDLEKHERALIHRLRKAESKNDD